MNFIDYPEERKIAIREYSFDEFKEFLNFIPAGILSNAIKVLPKMKGFRTGKDTEIRLKVFFGRIDRWDEKEWRLFSKIWLLWTASQDGLKNLLNCQDIKYTVEKMIESQDERLRIINNLVHGELTQDVIRYWLRFGPFNIDMDILWLVTLAPTPMIKKLQGRFDNLEERFVTSSEQQDELLKKQMQIMQENLSILSNDSDEFKQGISLLRGETARIRNKTQENAYAISTLGKDIDKLSKLESISSDSYKRLVDQVFLIKQKNMELEQHINALAVDHSRLEDGFKEINLNELISNAVWDKNANQIAASAEANQLVERSIEFELAPIQLSSSEEALTHLKSNLNSLGIKLADAKSISFEVLSAVLSNQLVMFSGSMAMFVAEYCAASLCGHTVKVINVPFGKTEELVSKERFDEWISEAKSYGHPIAIILEGMNRSAFEVYGANFKKFIAERIVRLKNEKVPIVFMATLVTGPSVLALSREFLEIGPVFNTDYIGWSYKNVTPYTNGVIESNILARQEIEINDYLEIEDLLPKGIVEHGSILWRKTIAATYKTMIQLDSSFDFSSVNFGWLIPTTSMCFSDHMEQLFDEIELDERCKALIKHMTLEGQ
ncbi:hypothetical protein P4H61_16250 [Paenibacillus peoriae]|uniref:hypothetical protein n=1 Tax=Paenibacillus peoriae TaxID=59893 RepID=UPI00026C5C85|nr:hypothetical protein [Paenibacillus peoriae]MEC0183038.1 hypothetical protein [Paenibacillus peoriae]